MKNDQENEHADGTVRRLPLDRIDDFPEHPFQVRMDESMDKLIYSIRLNGVIDPIVVRQKPDGRYETIQGHRRRKACEVLKKKDIPAVVVAMDDDEAAIAMVDSNLHRERILISEKAFAYKKKLEALKNQGMRTDLTSRPMDNKARERLTARKLGMLMGDSPEQVYRYIRITYLKEDLLGFVDSRDISFRAAVELSYLSAGEQDILGKEMEYLAVFPNIRSARALRRLSGERRIEPETVREVLMQGDVKADKWVRIPYEKTRHLIPNEVRNEEIPEFILKLLHSYRQARENGDGIPENRGST